MNIIIESLITRRSIRSYSSKMPDEELIDAVTKAGTYAPTGKGLQSPLIVAVTNRAVRDKLSKLNAEILGVSSDPFYGAPAVLVVFADKKTRTYMYDGSLVMGNLLNAAHALGLGSCWIHRAKEVFETPEGKNLMQEWGIPENYEGIGNCILGYASVNAAPAAKPRKSNYVVRIK